MSVDGVFWCTKINWSNANLSAEKDFSIKPFRVGSSGWLKKNNSISWSLGHQSFVKNIKILNDFVVQVSRGRNGSGRECGNSIRSRWKHNREVWCQQKVAKGSQFILWTDKTNLPESILHQFDLLWLQIWLGWEGKVSVTFYCPRDNMKIVPSYSSENVKKIGKLSAVRKFVKKFEGSTWEDYKFVKSTAFGVICGNFCSSFKVF